MIRSGDQTVTRQHATSVVSAASILPIRFVFGRFDRIRSLRLSALPDSGNSLRPNIYVLGEHYFGNPASERRRITFVPARSASVWREWRTQQRGQSTRARQRDAAATTTLLAEARMRICSRRTWRRNRRNGAYRGGTRCFSLPRPRNVRGI